MAILSDRDLKAENGVEFDNVIKPPGPASQDLHIKNLYKQRVPEDLHSVKGFEKFLKEFEETALDQSWAKFRKGLDRVPTQKIGDEEVWIINPNETYLAETMENVTLDSGYGMDVDTRSSWARFGLRVQHVEDELEGLCGYEGSVPLSINTVDKPIILRPEDRVCQGIVYEGKKGLLMNNEINEALKEDEIECYIPVPRCPGEKNSHIEISNNALQLNLHPEIKTYRESEIDPKEDQNGKYKEFYLGEGHELPHEKFFLGSSKEVVRVSDEYVGLLREIYNSPDRTRVHSNAGYIDPGFEGTITLEQFIPRGSRNTLYPGMKMGELEICRLNSKCEDPYDSKYNGQKGATASRAHLDYE